MRAKAIATSQTFERGAIKAFADTTARRSVATLSTVTNSVTQCSNYESACHRNGNLHDCANDVSVLDSTFFQWDSRQVTPVHAVFTVCESQKNVCHLICTVGLGQSWPQGVGHPMLGVQRGERGGGIFTACEKLDGGSLDQFA